MSTLADADKGAKKPQYKDYVSFLGNYKNGKKDDQCSVITNDSGVSFSLSNSSNNSSSSINSDFTDSPKNGFKEYMDHYNNKKYSPVQPAFIKKQPEEGKTVKTEVYIEITNPPPVNTVSHVSKVFEIKSAQNNNTNNNHCNAGQGSKIFENGHIKHKVNTFNFDQKEVETHTVVKHEKKKMSIGEISKKFEENIVKNQPVNETPKSPLKKQSSIKEMSKVFQENDNNKVFEAAIKKSVIQTANDLKHKDDIVTQNGTVSPRPQINAIKPVMVPKSFTENSERAQPKPLKIVVLPPTPPPPQSTNNSTPNIPPPPPFQTEVIPSKTISSSQQHQTPPQIKPVQNGMGIPPPPPPPPVDFSAKRTQSLPRNPAAKSLTNGTSGGKLQNGQPNDRVDGTAAPAIDKNDPRVKKLVYGALREMYGAYHDKANDYIATLPRNRVKKNNGLDSIIDSIASQGGLEKLTGRVNPNVEKE